MGKNKNRSVKGCPGLSRKDYEKARKRGLRRLRRGFSPVVGKDNLREAVKASLGAV
ncbi:hypothetical protein MishRS11D_45940 (plasmid) [Methylomagnum ishizawai]|nr:hypothetical protein MishRS11D_45940 [Methylomagnum ishizawai]